MTINGPKRYLYQVTLTAMVMALDDRHAAEVASEMRPWNSTCDVELADSSPIQWFDCIPFGSPDDRTVEEVLREQKQREAPNYHMEPIWIQE